MKVRPFMKLQPSVSVADWFAQLEFQKLHITDNFSSIDCESNDVILACQDSGSGAEIRRVPVVDPELHKGGGQGITGEMRGNLQINDKENKWDIVIIINRPRKWPVYLRYL